VTQHHPLITGSIVAALTPPVALVTLVLLFHWGILGGLGIIPYDASTDFYPIARLAVESARDGNLTDAWNPWIVGGVPQAGLSLLQYDPFYWIAAVIPGEFTEYRFDVLVIWHLAFGGLGAYCLARSMSMSDWPAVVTGLVFALGGRATSLLQHTATVGEVMAWFPWSALFLRLAITSASPGFPLAFLGALGAAFGIGHWTTGPAEAPNYVLGVVALGAAPLVVTGAAPLRRAAMYSGLWITMAVALLAAPITLMGIIGSDSTSKATEIWRGELAALPAASLPTALLPGAVGNTRLEAFIGGGDPTETWLYWGLFTFLLAAYAVARTRSRADLLLAAAGGVGLLLALGMVTPAYSALYILAPPVRYLLRAEPYLIIYALAIALLAGRGTAALVADIDSNNGSLRARFGLGMAAIALVSISGSMAAIASSSEPLARLINEDAAVAALLALILATAFATYAKAWRGRHLLTLVLIGVVFADVWHAGAFRHFSFQSGGGSARPDSLDGDRETVVALRELAAPLAAHEYRVEPVAAGAGWENGSLVAGIQTLGGSISVDPERLTAVLGPRQHRIASGRPVFQGVIDSYASPLFEAFNVRFIVTALDYPGDVDPLFEDSDFELVSESAGRKIYENDEALPRARLTGAVPAADRDAAVQLLEDGRLDPRLMTVLEGIATQVDPPSGPSPGRVVIESYEMSRVRLGVRAERESVLVLADNYAPGWKASVDGERAEVHPANVVHRGVVVPAGSHTVEFWYAPARLRLAWVVSLGTFATGTCVSLALLPLALRGKHRARAGA
jgi:hypothetical protein